MAQVVQCDYCKEICREHEIYKVDLDLVKRGSVEGEKEQEKTDACGACAASIRKFFKELKEPKPRLRQS